ncbi:MAG: MarR family transcriptional regulator [Pseudomonadota bacterium]
MDNTATNIRVLRAIRRIIRAVDLHSKTLQQAQDITAPQLVCLLTLVRLGALTLKALSQAIDLSPSTTVGVVDRLAAKGLVERTRSASDRRQVRVSATAAGHALARQSPSPLQDRLVARLGALPVAEQLQLAGALERLVGLMGADAIDASAILDLAPITEAAAPAPAAAAREHPAARALSGSASSAADAAGRGPATRFAPDATPAASALTRHTVIGGWPRSEP